MTCGQNVKCSVKLQQHMAVNVAGRFSISLLLFGLRPAHVVPQSYECCVAFPRISVNKSSKITKLLFSTPLFELSHNVFSSHCVRRLEKHVLREAKCREDGNIFNRLFFEIIRISSNWIKPLKGTFKNICNKKATMSKRSFFFPLLHKKGSWGQILVIHYKGKTTRVSGMFAFLVNLLFLLCLGIEQ